MAAFVPHADGERLQVVTDTQRRMGRDAFFGAAKIDGEAGSSVKLSDVLLAGDGGELQGGGFHARQYEDPL